MTTRPSSVAIFALPCSAALFGLLFRYPGLDQSYLLLTAWEFVAGKGLYVGVYDLPPSALFHSLPILLHNVSGLSVVFSWNALCASLCCLSGFLFFRFVTGRSQRIFAIVWTLVLLLAFDDYVMGAREFLFAIFWIPYLGARLNVQDDRHHLSEVVVGGMVGFFIAVKPYFALYVILIDLPLFFLRKKRSATLPFVAMVVSGLIQIILFLMLCEVSRVLEVIRQIAYYRTVGFNYTGTIAYIISSLTPWLSAAIAIIYFAAKPFGKLSTLFALCLITSLVTIALMIVQGQPRPIYLTPAALSNVAAAGIIAQHCRDCGTNRWMLSRVFGAAVLVPVFYAFTAHGLLIGIFKKYALDDEHVETIGRPAHDEFLEWVTSHVPQHENIGVIALQPGYPAMDPILSLLRLDRRAFGRMPVLNFPLRAALFSNDAEEKAKRVREIIEDFEQADIRWLIVRRDGPGPPIQNVWVALEGIPTFQAWLNSRFKPTPGFGHYIVYRRSET